MIIMFSSVASLFQRHMEVYIKKSYSCFFYLQKRKTLDDLALSRVCAPSPARSALSHLRIAAALHLLLWILTRSGHLTHLQVNLERRHSMFSRTNLL